MVPGDLKEQISTTGKSKWKNTEVEDKLFACDITTKKGGILHRWNNKMLREAHVVKKIKKKL